MKPYISGIQQIGIGVANCHQAWEWYRKVFGMQIPVFEEAAVADLMLPYTGGEPRSRHAVLALNPEGGGGMEIWQYTERIPQKPDFEVRCGDLGIFSAKIKSRNIAKTYQQYKEMDVEILNEPSKGPDGKNHFYVKDPYGNIFEIVECATWFNNKKLMSGGPVGCLIGVTDMDKSIAFYNHILGYDTVVYDETAVFDDMKALPGGESEFRRVLLRHRNPRKGAFSRFFGNSTIELLQVKDRKPEKIYENRFWGDLGFIHLCFDINGMDELRSKCEAYGHPFSVDSATKHDETFDMGEASGQFSYIEDPDGALIEFVETHKIPVMKKFGWYLDLRKRKPEKHLPDLIFKAMSLNRVRD